jgi:hypothetical protein
VACALEAREAEPLRFVSFNSVLGRLLSNDHCELVDPNQRGDFANGKCQAELPIV